MVRGLRGVPLLGYRLNERTFPARRKGRSRKAKTKQFNKAGCKLRSTSFENRRRNTIRTIRLLSIKLRERAEMTSLEEITILGINELEGVEGGGIAPESSKVELEAKV